MACNLTFVMRRFFGFNVRQLSHTARVSSALKWRFEKLLDDLFSKFG